MDDAFQWRPIHLVEWFRLEIGFLPHDLGLLLSKNSNCKVLPDSRFMALKFLESFRDRQESSFLDSRFIALKFPEGFRDLQESSFPDFQVCGT